MMKPSNFLLFALSLLGAAQAEACTASAVPLSPSNMTRSPVSGSSQVAFSVSVSLDCVAGETYTITSPSASYTASVGSSGQNVQGVFYSDASLSLPLLSNAVTGTAATTGTTTRTIYGVLQGTGGGNFIGAGAYSLPMSINATSTFGAPVALTYTESGVVQGTCSVGNAVASFGSFSASTAHPIQPVSISLNCTSGLSWSLGQPSVAPVSIGSTTTNTGWLYSDAGGSTPLNSTPVTGTGIGSSQNINLFAGLSGATISEPISGAGAVSGTILIVVTY